MRVDVDATDPRLEPYRHVGDPAWLQAHGLFVAEGRLVVERLIATRRYAIDSIIVTPAAYAALAARHSTRPTRTSWSAVRRCSNRSPASTSIAAVWLSPDARR